jgi:hypothetical protein
VDEPLYKALVDVTELLGAQELPYAVIGGLAVSLRGQPRVTADVDLVLGISIDAALGLIPLLGDTVFEPLFSGIEEVVERSFILPLRHRPTRVKVDLAIGLSGFEQQVVARASPINIGGRDIRVATPEDLVILKLFAGRPRDQQDIEGIVAAQHNVLDWEYCLRTAQSLGDAVDQDLTSQIERLRRGADYES